MTPFELSRDRWGKAYVGGEVTVSYDAARCIHFAACVRGLPDVFRPGERPWIRPDGAAGRLVAEVVLSCPTGALHFTAPDGTTETPEPGPTVVEPQPDGPLFVRGQVVVRTPNGELRDTRVALCRCGASGNQPFCDGTHVRIGWRSSDGPPSGG